MGNPSRSRPSGKAATAIDKPPRPYPDFPLTPHNSGAWQKKLNGDIHYFGKWGRGVNGVLTRIQEEGCWAEALKLFQAQADDLYAGRRPRGKRTNLGAGDGDASKPLTVKDLGNTLLTVKHRKRDSGE